MSSDLKGFKVACPKCGDEKQINVPASLFYQKKFGTVKIKVPQGVVCPDHEFIVFISTKGLIVGYDIIDTSVSSDQDGNLSKEISKLSLDELIDVLGFNCVVGLIHAKLFDYPSFVVRSDKININIEQLDEMFDRLIPLQYRNDNAIKDVEFDSYVFTNENFFYTAFKETHNNAFLITNRKQVLQRPWVRKCDFEKTILDNALGKSDKTEQLKYLAQYINQFIKDVEFTKALLDNSKKISEKDLLKQLKEKLIVSTINKKRILIIKEFIRRRFSEELSKRIKN
jgi:hypothetical protein